MHNDFYTAPPTFACFRKKLRELHADFPFLQFDALGQSLLGRPLTALTLGAPSPCVLFAGAFHAQEWLTCSLLVRFLEHLSLACREDTPIAGVRVRESLAERGLTVVPMVNPDGVSIALEGPESAGSLAASVRRLQSRGASTWQANARGVDLNHNFDAGWHELRRIEADSGVTGPGPRQFGGAYPHSEPESRALADFLRGRRVEAAYAFHSQGEEIYGEYGAHTPAKSKYLGRLLAGASGYRLVQNGGLCSHGGFKDYFIEKYHRPGFTFEIGRGENPLPITDLEDIYAVLLEPLVIAALV